MRFLKIFFGLAVGGVVILSALMYFRTEVGLWLAGRNLGRDIEKLNKIAINRNERHYCIDQKRQWDLRNNSQVGSQAQESASAYTEIYRLRFTSSEDYVIEVDCKVESEMPKVISEGKLDFGAMKVSGAGIELVANRTREETASVIIKINELYREVGLRRGVVFDQKSNEQQRAILGSNIVQTSCEGWGYMCCDPQTSVGLGELNQHANSCKSHCYEACASRPAILYFNSDPIMDPRTRSVTLHSNPAQINFGYQIDDWDSENLRIGIDFGDGQMQAGLSKSQRIGHTYICNSDICRYEVKLMAEDEGKLTIAETNLSKITVVVQP